MENCNRIQHLYIETFTIPQSDLICKKIPLNLAAASRRKTDSDMTQILKFTDRVLKQLPSPLSSALQRNRSNEKEKEKGEGCRSREGREEKEEGPVGVDLGDTGDHQPHNLI